MPCSPVDGRDAGHCVIVTDSLSQEPVPDLPGEHSWVLSLVFSNLVHHFGRRYFGLGAANHSRLDAASLVVPAPGKAGGVSEKQRSSGGRDRGDAGSGAAEATTREGTGPAWLSWLPEYAWLGRRTQRSMRGRTRRALPPGRQLCQGLPSTPVGIGAPRS